MATMSNPAQNTICIGAEKTNIRVVNPSGKGKGMRIHQKERQNGVSAKNNFVEISTTHKIFSILFNKNT